MERLAAIKALAAPANPGPVTGAAAAVAEEVMDTDGGDPLPSDAVESPESHNADSAARSQLEKSIAAFEALPEPPVECISVLKAQLAALPSLAPSVVRVPAPERLSSELAWAEGQLSKELGKRTKVDEAYSRRASELAAQLAAVRAEHAAQLAAFDLSVASLRDAVSVAAKAVQDKHSVAVTVAPAAKPEVLITVAPGAIAELRNHVLSLGTKLDRTREEITPAVDSLLVSESGIPQELHGLVKDLMLRAAVSTTSALSAAHFNPLRRWLDGAGVADTSSAGTTCLVDIPGVASAAGRAGGGTTVGAPVPDGAGTPPSPRNSAQTRPLEPGAEVSAAKVVVRDGEL